MTRYFASPIVVLAIAAGCNQSMPIESPQVAGQPRADQSPRSHHVKPAATPAVASIPAAGLSQDADFLAKVRAANSSSVRLPQRFRTGHADVRSIEADLVSKTEHGFTVSLPSQSPVPTPLVHDGRIYVGGGFSSKEFYCFDANTGTPIWSVDFDDDGPSSAAAEDDTVIINTESCTIFALAADTGTMRWSYWLGDPLMSIPAVANGKVFTVYPVEPSDEKEGDDAHPNVPDATAKTSPDELDASFWHALICFDVRTGDVLWQRLIDSDCISSPVAVDDAIYITTFSGNLYEFGQVDGEIRAASKVRATSAPVIAGSRIYLTRRTDTGADDAEVREGMVMLDRRDAHELYVANDRAAPYLDRHIQELANSTKAAGAMEMKNGIMGGFGAGFFAIAADDEPAANEEEGPVAETEKGAALELDQLAKTELKAAANIGQGNVSMLQSFQGSRVLSLGEWNCSCMGNSLVCSIALTGNPIWTLPLEGNLEEEGGHLAAPPVVAGDRLFLATLKGEVLQLVPATGAVEKAYHIGEPIRFAPSVVNGRIYIGTQNGKLICVETHEPRFTGWPAWGGSSGRNNLHATTRN